MSETRPDPMEAIRLAAQAEFARAPAVRPWWVDASLLMGVNLVTGVGLALAMTVNTQQHDSLVLRWLGALGLLALAGFGAVAAVRPGWRLVRIGLVGAASALVLVVLAAASGAGAFGGMGCGAIEAIASLVPVLVSLVVLSKFAPDPLRTVVAGLSAGAGGLFALHLHCPNGALSHLVVFHLAPWLLISVLAVGLRRLVKSSTFAP
jgi:hypothetical protein